MPRLSPAHRSVWSAAALAALLAAAPSQARAEPVDYGRDIRPLLTERCYKCHGADEQKSGLRLDTVASAVEGGYSGPAIERGRGAASLLVKALNGQDDVVRMPPEGPPLSAAQIELVRRWIDEGAAAPADDAPPPVARRSSDHWSFQPIVRHQPPPVDVRHKASTAIDAFILARLEQEGLEPSPLADRTTLIRRLSLDLTGLPPTLAEVDAFLADEQPDAYERLVDRLLASPHYGERWARHWLDLARYADSNGYTNDNPRSIWKYRDWVISSLNRDLPFDQFTIEQFAGDMLPEPTMDQLIATGFHRNTLQNEEGGTDPEEFRIEAVVDRVATTGAVYLGLTLGCARCHDHKYDPISQRDFYRVFALLNGADEPTLPVPTPKQHARQTEFQAQLAAAEAPLRAYDAGSADRRTLWERQFDGQLEVAWTPLEPLDYRSTAGAVLTRLPDASLLAGGERPERDTYVVSTGVPIAAVTAVRLEVLRDDALPYRGPGRAENGRFVLGEMALAVRDAATAPRVVPWQSAAADASLPDFPAAHLIDGDPRTGWAPLVDPNEAEVVRRATLITAEDLAPAADRALVFTLVHDHKEPGYLLGRFRLLATSAPRNVLALSEAARAALAVAPAERTPAQQQAVLAEYQKTDPERQRLAAEVAKIEAQLAELTRSMTTTLVMRERQQPRTTHLLVRGEYLRNGAVVQPGVPAVLPQIPPEVARPSRLDLARWLVDPANPLVARVTVNRIWQQYFGRGLVETTNDFGTQGARPTHPELLDWLATELIARGWSLKALHRAIVTSDAYRRSSRSRADLAEVDPDNKLLARQSRLRVEAEVVRDLALAASGLLSTKVGGPSVFPPQPDGVMALTRSPRPWEVSKGEDRYRRGMYTYFWRSTPHPFLKVFDAPDGNTTCTRRERANTPLQALTLLNDEACFEAAGALAARIARECPDRPAGERLRHAFRLCLAREPSDRERACLAELLADELADASRAASGTSADDARQAETAAWTSVARALLNLDELMTRE